MQVDPKISEDQIQAVTQEVARQIGDGPTQNRLDKQKRDFLNAFSAARRTKSLSTWTWLVPTVAAAAVLIVAFIWLIPSSPQKLQYWVADQVAAHQSSELLVAFDNSSLSIRFENGSFFELAPGSKGKFKRADQQLVDFWLQSGRVTAKIQAQNSTTWQVSYGPFIVETLGTNFEVAWITNEEQLLVKVHSGKVRVSGAWLDAAGMLVLTGKQLKLDLNGNAKLFDMEPLSASVLAPLEPEVKTTIEPEVKKKSPPKEDPPKKPVTKMANLEKTPEPKQLSAQDLWHLADQARYHSQPQKAIELYKEIRKLEPKTPRAATAAFLVGRVYAEQLKDHQEAAKWFLVYIQELPQGPLVEESYGRRLQVLKQSKQTDAFKQLAQEYLKKFPEGRYKALAGSDSQ
jgi:ferric-dicitrate binding protein FerR (iron transport regulator)